MQGPSQHITTAKARERGLPGSDVYIYSHLLYHDTLNRAHGVLRLNLEAMKAFTDTVLVSQRHAIATEQAAMTQWMEQGGLTSTLPFPPGRALSSAIHYVNYEHLKIASAFELHLKARLLAREVSLHEIDPKVRGCKALAKEQRARPIQTHELLSISEYHFNGQHNYLPGLKDKSLTFSLLIENASYRKALRLTEEQLGIIEDYRALRNQIHFPGDIVECPRISAFPSPIIDFITEFINVELVAWCNDLIDTHNSSFPRFARVV